MFSFFKFSEGFLQLFRNLSLFDSFEKWIPCQKSKKSECCGELKECKCCSKNDVEKPKSVRGHWCYKTWCCGYIFKKKFERLRKLSKNGK